MNYYIDYNEDGRVIKTQKGKGRTRRGYINYKNTLWVNSNIIEDFKKKEKSGIAGTTIVKSKEKYSFDELKSIIKKIRHKNRKDGIVSFVGCNIKGDYDIPYLKPGQVFSRIDIDKKLGNISIWKTIYTENKPDIIIEDIVLVG